MLTGVQGELFVLGRQSVYTKHTNTHTRTHTHACTHTHTHTQSLLIP